MQIVQLREYAPEVVFVGFIVTAIISCCSIKSAIVFWGVIAAGLLFGYLTALIIGTFLGFDEEPPGLH
ncbi:MAG: hypothetical protein A3H70_03025 [Candidatus Komeilibacteria bacterium RIFCSPLOWO2_02_FULL_48_11]|uniref:Uncharacterized protein n=1 Tax=Candidatus Komeilibacteria bacterium RIFCSPLOWO2_02_FULL_48_11 TaxID=1798553 RepID=A0A1G2BPE9_9BACT|nr:MAG: hypothetical protein A3H70_03025 [Candidatus Komeilibacteria bacterium RIFCSPLOWO2_02_FULL_48_11]